MMLLLLHLYLFAHTRRVCLFACCSDPMFMTSFLAIFNNHHHHSYKDRCHRKTKLLSDWRVVRRMVWSRRWWRRKRASRTTTKRCSVGPDQVTRWGEGYMARWVLCADDYFGFVEREKGKSEVEQYPSSNKLKSASRLRVLDSSLNCVKWLLLVVPLTSSTEGRNRWSKSKVEQAAQQACAEAISSKSSKRLQPGFFFIIFAYPHHVVPRSCDLPPIIGQPPTACELIEHDSQHALPSS